MHPLLDLHGLTADEAVRRARGWLRDERDAGHRTVVVVTGRGNRSRGPAVLRAEMEHLLDGLRGSLVSGWETDAAGGAFRVQLTPPPPPPRTLPERDASRRIAAADPGLRARAEDALWELGVTPTPALVDAEIRRLQRESARDAGED